MQFLESFFLGAGLSWTLSKALPYLLSILLGILLMRIALKRLRSINNALRIVIAVFVLILPFALGFITNPIFEGDFSKNGRSLEGTNHPDLKSDGLKVISIPGCPFCVGSIPKLKKIKERYPEISIEYVLCSSDTNNLTSLRKEIDGKFALRLAKDKNGLAEISLGSFPAFAIVENGNASYIWSNDEFGVRAIDVVEDKFSAKK